MRSPTAAVALFLGTLETTKGALHCSDTIKWASGQKADSIETEAGDFVDKGWSMTEDASQGAVKFFQDLRAGDDQFYEDALEAMMAVYCVDLSEMKDKRYVDKTDALAELSADGKCIKAKDFDPEPTDYCEIVETCYWEPVVVGEDRLVKIEDVPAQRENLNTYYVDMATQYLGPPIAVGVINFLVTLVFFYFTLLLW